MNYQHLLHQREALLRQARLANVAFAHDQLASFGARIARAGLRGAVTLQTADPEADRPWPVLTAHTCSQAVIEEHFTDEDMVELADILVFVSDDAAAEFNFRLEELTAEFQPALRRELEDAGILLEQPAPEDSRHRQD